jgi:hypothetical protein
MSEITQIIPEILGPKYRPVEPSPGPQWMFWQMKNLNAHRALIYWKPNGVPSVDEIESEVRSKVREVLRKSWWRGLAFGVVIDLKELPDTADGLVDHIDGRANSKGVWQWSVVCARDLQLTVGVHTWMHVMTTPFYMGLLGYFDSQGFGIGDFKKEKDKLLRFLTTVGGAGDSLDYNPGR